jgi:pimeloyl-ACP methyl ester carboxylesterase
VGSHSHTGVALDSLIDQSSSLGVLATELRLRAGELLGVLAASPAAALGAPASAVEAHRRLEDAVNAVLRAASAAGSLHDAVHASVARYERAEQLARDAAAKVAHEFDQGLMWLLGVDVRLFGLPLLVGVGGTVLLSKWLTGNSAADELRDFFRTHGRILTNRTTVAIIREAANDLPDFAAGLLGVPPEFVMSANDAGLTTPRTDAGAIETVGSAFGLFRETGVSVKKTSVFEFGRPAASLVDRAQSFLSPDSDPNGEQIRIDRYSVPGQADRFDVFIAGTQDFSPVSGSEPFDLTGDIAGIAQNSPASYRAVIEAMHQAGVTSTSPVVLNGHSQGGLIAVMVAASGQFDVKGVLTFGAPATSIPVPQHVPVLALRNSEDLVPALGGYDTNTHAVIVERPVFDHQPIPTEWAVPAHRLEYYEQTARWADTATDPRVANIRDILDGFGADANHVESTLWVATRT